MKVNAPISDQQWGFSPGKSTAFALLSFTHNCSEALDNGKEVAAIFFDLSKAIDSVPHLPLLRKLVDIHLDPYVITGFAATYLAKSNLSSSMEHYLQFYQLSLGSPRALSWAPCSF